MKEMAVISVSQLNRYVKSLFEADHILNGLMVRGEISNFLCHYKSGHMYFTLKDETAAIKSVMFRSYAGKLPFMPENGMSVIVSGSVSLYERDGGYQLYVTDMQPDGIGSLHLAYEQLKERLSREGLFDEARKRPLPHYPERIGIVTSEGAAALQDMLNILSRRYPVARITLFPAKVQGEGAAQTVIDGIRRLNEDNACDVMIIGRGGGSIEDLWAFNNEQLAYAIVKSKIPIISAVGHETDFTIADFAADLRAPTPSAAAELVAPDISDLLYYLADIGQRCYSAAARSIGGLEARIQMAQSRLVTPAGRVERYSQQLSFLTRTLHDRVGKKLADGENKLARLAEAIEGRSPIKILSRGYGLTTVDGKSVHSVSQLERGNEIKTRVADGEISSTVTAIKEISA